MPTDPGSADDGRVLATRAITATTWRLLAVVWAFNAALATWRAFREPTTFSIAFLVVLLVSVGASFWAARNSRRTRLVLTPDVLTFEHPRRPWTVRREDVLAVRGDIKGRPTWSERVIVETRNGERTVPALDESAGRLIPELQRWAGVDEQPAPAERPSREEF